MIDIGNIEATGLWVGNKKADAAYVGIVKVWGQSAPLGDWLCFTAEEANSTVAMTANGSAPAVSLEYSTNGSTWSPFEVGTTTVTLANIGDKVYVRATSAGNTGMATSAANSNRFVMTGKIAASGNVDTLLDQNGNATLTSYCYAYLFNGCTSLTTAPTLPSITLAARCYSNMFNGCSLTTAPALPATTLAEYCYALMFRGCTSLTTAPELPATTLAQSCYSDMFYGCTSLTTAPALPVTTLANGCYNNMFQGCTSLTSAPALPATTLVYGCYSGMFWGCTSLTTAPELPATTLAERCYLSMFRNCSSLTTAPTLPAITLVSSCYNYMFNGCANLNSITLGYTGNFSDTYFNTWVSGVAASGTFHYDGTDTTTGVSAIPTGWVVVAPLCFTAEEANSTVRLDKVGSPNAISLETSTDKSTWTDYTWSGDTGATLTLANVGDKVYMRAKTTNQAIGSSVVNYHKFVMTGKIAASGDVDTLLDKSGIVTLTSYCYAYLFYGCSSLTSTPTLPATSLASDCYYGMFEDCTSLTTAPELPATTLANYCYRNMFRSCSSLTSAPELRATTLADYCYANTFNGCTSLTTAPELPATTLATNCYLGMFNGCSNLNTITLGYTGNFADAPSNAFTNWVNGVAASGTFYYDGTDTTTGVSAIPVGWTMLPIPIPELCFTAREANATVGMTKSSYAPTLYLQTSVDDGETWQQFIVGSTTITLANIGDRVLFRTSPGRTNSGTATYNSTYRRLGANSFSFGGQVKVSGRLESLLYPDFKERDDITLADYAFWRLFYKCPGMRGTIDCSHIGSCGQSTFGETFSEDGITSSGRWSIENVDFSGLHTIYAATSTAQLSTSTFYATFDSCNSMSCLSLPNLTNDGLAYSQCGNMNNICYNCDGLQVVDLSNLKQLYRYGLAYAFMNCVGLRKVYLTNLSAMGGNGFKQTFDGCTMLELVDFSHAAAVPSLAASDTAFANTNNTYKVVVPDALYSNWVSDSGWSSISSHIVKASEYTPT